MGLLKLWRDIRAKKHTHVLVRDNKYTGQRIFGKTVRLDNMNAVDLLFFQAWCRKNNWKYVKLNK